VSSKADSLPDQPESCFADLTEHPETPCPCGTARRAFASLPDAPASVHQVDISIDAQTHYHRRQTEIYYFLECGEGAKMALDSKLYPVRSGMCVLIKPLTRHRAVGKMRILNIVIPPFDPDDEWFD